jgi:hypothetical protein
MRKSILYATLVLAGLILTPLGAGSALAANPPDGPVKVTNFGKKNPVTFDHAKHKDLNCVSCHHKEKEGKYKCGECHKAEEQGKTPKLADAMHKKDVGKCWSCHRAEDAKNKFKCNDCHKK